MKIEKGKLYLSDGKLVYTDYENIVTDKIAVHCPTKDDWEHVVSKGYELVKFINSGYYCLSARHWDDDINIVKHYGYYPVTIDQFKEFYPMSDTSIKSDENVHNNVHPTHYTNKGIQPIDYIEANKLDFNEGNVIKYVTRYKDKNGLEDLKKAKFYLERLISNHEK